MSIYAELSNFFQKAVKTQGVSENFSVSSYSHSNPVNNTIRIYENRPSLINIKGTKNIPTKCLKVTSDIYSLFLAIIWNEELISYKNNYHKS